MKINSETSRFIKVASIICAAMVVGIHAYNATGLEQWSPTSRIIGSLSHGLFMAAVPIFFCISGYLFFSGANSIRDVFVKQKRRIVTLLVPFLSWSAVYCLFYYVKDGMFKSSDFNWGTLFSDIVFYEYNFPMWFAFQLIIYVIIGIPLYYLKKNKITEIVLLIISAVLGLIGIQFSIKVGDTERTLFAFNYFFYYWLGSCLVDKDWLCWIKEKTKRISVWIWTALLIVFSGLQGILFDIVEFYNNRMLVPVIAIISVVVIAYIAERTKKSRCLTVLFCVPTMVLYGLHQLVENLVFAVVRKLMILPTLAEFFIVFALTLIITGIAALLIKRIKVLNFLFNGNR